MVGIKAEWDPLKKVVMHRPGIEMFFSLIEPYASLYDRAFSQNEALREHERLEHILMHEFRVDVIRLKDFILQEAERSSKVKEELVKMAEERVEFRGDEEDVKMAKDEFSRYKDIYDSEFFFNLILLSPKVTLERGRGERAIYYNVTVREPLGNLYFMRDQQAVTDKGIILSRMSKPQRRRETQVTKFLWKLMGEEIVHEIKEPGTFEGGDFIPMKDFALIGTGDRTNQEGIEQILKHGVSFDEVAVVHQPAHPLIPGDQTDPMINMHLDTYFNVPSSNVVIGCDTLLKRAKIDVYIKESEGNYRKEEERNLNLYDYIKEKGFEIINITTLEQMSYASNFLTIKDGTILAIETERIVKRTLANLEASARLNPERYGKLLEQAKKDYEHLKNEGQFFPHKKEMYKNGIDVYTVDLTNLTGGYGGAHCMTCSLRRG
ncbi:amidinotransferase [Fervidicoccus fontis]|uniref:Amidinotransferase n=1 Tax=Fervidicoccus fontis TaxID=683846 RepID=A0A7C2Z9V9_9CREN|nr:arginine deiminase family protein [Fervidicoccus fontis]MBE9391549.1 amidinotransferase [Fervidicoccus fontis]PMB76364.1 MAG: amidinotransferase [Fervidicoccus fontis]HEW63615.1 amidinotransferase [Fervidicoccus fontis]